MRIDGHVHLVGDGSQGSGCWFSMPSAWKKMQARVMLRALGLPVSALRGGLDEVYIEGLKAHLLASDLDGVLLLAQDVPHDDAGRPMAERGSFYVPNEWLLRVCAEHSTQGARLIPCVSIHPGREDALDELEMCIAGGARGLKLLPNCLNVNCNDQRQAKFWQRVADANLVFVCHTGGEYTVPVLNKAYASPEILRQPLECGVLCVAAHGAGRSGVLDKDYTKLLIEMMGRYDNLYADNSALSSLNRARTVPALREVSERVVHGSDYPVPSGGMGPWLWAGLSWREARLAAKEKSILARDVQLKRAMGFDEGTFTRLAKRMGW